MYESLQIRVRSGLPADGAGHGRVLRVNRRVQHQPRSSQSLRAGTMPSCPPSFEHRVLNNKKLLTKREAGLEDAADLLLEGCVHLVWGHLARPGGPSCCSWMGLVRTG